ncbi:MAG TPA: phenylalanine--tRNA ligase subunit beta [Chlamydiales bacterium]|nr:phenylalanine--tRNA ligase subunit beta [Chlamydiales bacterium]
MKVPLSLIQSFIDIDLPAAQIASLLTFLGIEVDAIENEHPSFAGVVAAEILSCAPHPNASKLQIAQVSDGKEILQIVCGAPNCRPGMKSALAPPGTLLQGKKIEKVEIRGVTSSGMLCSEDELGIAAINDGIIELPENIAAGASLVPYLWDPVFVISLTPNLGHCMSALGIARELSARLQKPLRPLPRHTPQHAKIQFKVSQPPSSLCSRYIGRVIENVSIAPSPFWMQRQLLSCGFTPICNAVDITNYILIKFGQPLHVFDRDKLEGATLFVEAASAAEAFLGLDGVQREAPIGAILIADSQGTVAIGGIMGGARSAVSKETKNLFFEAAIFDPGTIRQTSKKLGLRTESSQRFEKGVDPIGIDNAIDAACSLAMDLCKGRFAGEIDWKTELQPRQIHCRPERINQLLGTRLSITEMEEIFHRLQFQTDQEKNETLFVHVPFFRSDIVEEIDLAEEVARIYGYNHFERPSPKSAPSQIPHDPMYLFEKKIRERLVGFGLQEFLNSDLISKKLAQAALEWIRPGAAPLRAVYAKTEEYSVLRPSLLPGLLQRSQINFNHKNQTLAAFEIGRIHFLQNNELIEEPMTALILSGNNRPSHWSQKPMEFDFFDLKGYLENLFDAIHLPFFTFSPSQHLTFHPGRQADIFCNEQRIGSFGEVHPTLLEMFEIKQRIFYAEMNLHLMLQQVRSQIKMKPLSQFPSSDRDWTVSLLSSSLIQTIFDAIRSTPALLLEKVELIDLYMLENGEKKNATFRFTYRDPLKTISFEEVEATHAKLIRSIEQFLAK